MAAPARVPAVATAERKTWTLPKESELRFQIAADKTFTVVLTELTAEIFGVELAAHTEYYFSGTQLAVFTWFGCTLETTGTAEHIYVSDETPMIPYVNTHTQLESRRDQALAELLAGKSTSGPRVLIAGAADSGKSSLSNILCAYAVRLGRTPTFVDLDIGQGQITVPGAMAAVALDSSTLSVDEGFSLAAPLAFYFGHTSQSENPELFRQLVTRLAECVEQRLSNDKDAAAAGLIINTCGWVEGLGLELLRHCIRALAVDIVLVVGNDKLYAELSSDNDDLAAGARPVHFTKVPRSGGVVTRSQQHRRAARAARIKEYFYGASHPEKKGAGPALSPSILELKFSDVKICRVGGASLSGGLLPLGQASMLGPTRVSRVKPSAELLHSVLAVCHPVLRADGTVVGAGDESSEVGQEIIDSNAAGFVFVTEVDMVGRRMSVLSPCPGGLPSDVLILGSVKWTE